MNMKRLISILLACFTLVVVASCTADPARYNTQKGAAIGAGVGAIMGQAIGRNTEGTLLGAGIGTLFGAIVGNAVDQSNQAAREAAVTNRRVVYYDDQGRSVEAIPGPYDNQQTNCRKVTKRVWDRGSMTSETVEEVCEGEKKTRDY